MIYTNEQLAKKYNCYGDVRGKISRDVACEKLFKICKCLYEDDQRTSGEKFAQFIYGPSYLSFDYVLSKNGLIPSMLFPVFTCASCTKLKKKKYDNFFGSYSYLDVPSKVFSLLVNYVSDGEYSYLVASTEKALCDKLYSLHAIKNVDELKVVLFQKLQIIKSQFNKLNKQDIFDIAPLYGSNNVKLLAKYLREETDE